MVCASECELDLARNSAKIIFSTSRVYPQWKCAFHKTDIQNDMRFCEDDISNLKASVNWLVENHWSNWPATCD